MVSLFLTGMGSGNFSHLILLHFSNYELYHLGNVLAVVTDCKLSQDNGFGGEDFYATDVVSYSDYCPFGMQLPGRNGSAGDYRYGFQGQEKDDEIKGDGNSVNYKYRIHDTRIGRFFAIDPIANQYPHNGPYNFSENIVIHGVELEGLEVGFINYGATGGCLGVFRGTTSLGFDFSESFTIPGVLIPCNIKMATFVTVSDGAGIGAIVGGSVGAAFQWNGNFSNTEGTSITTTLEGGEVFVASGNVTLAPTDEGAVIVTTGVSWGLGGGVMANVTIDQTLKIADGPLESISAFINPAQAIITSVYEELNQPQAIANGNVVSSVSGSLVTDNGNSTNTANSTKNTTTNGVTSTASTVGGSSMVASNSSTTTNNKSSGTQKTSRPASTAAR